MISWDNLKDLRDRNLVKTPKQMLIYRHANVADVKKIKCILHWYKKAQKLLLKPKYILTQKYKVTLVKVKNITDIFVFIFSFLSLTTCCILTLRAHKISEV